VSERKFVIWCLVFLFCGLGFAYNIMGFGNSLGVEEGQGGLHRTDRNQSIDMAEFILDGDFGFYSRETMNVAMISEPGGRYNYPPMSGIIEAPVVLFSRLMGMKGGELFDISIFPFILLSGLAILIICSVFEKYTAEEVTNGGIILISIFLFSGLLFYSVVREGKFEGMIAFFALLGIFFLPKSKTISGICFGLAICTKQIAVLLVIPTFFVLLQEKQYKDLIRWGAAVSITALIIMVPFILGSGFERVHLSLSKNMDLFRIQGSSTIGYIYRITSFITGGENKAFEEFLQFYANKFVLLICILASFLFSTKRKINTSTPERFFALLVFCSFIFIVLGKYYTSGIYEVGPTYFLVLWAIASRETVFGAIVLLLQSFFCSDWPLALYRNQLLLLLYLVTILYVWRTSLAGGKEDAVTSPNKENLTAPSG
jgi:hypothetical protein